ncbi:hypothetical protein MHK_010118 [Candidatus Magnetomorum sp. HK-1]|nr:hypothetical protein MHK_010118 [Candidatus Magnetomorum sp. HK-1]
MHVGFGCGVLGEMYGDIKPKFDKLSGGLKDMRIKEKIYNEINMMNIEELLIMYQHISLLKKNKKKIYQPQKKRTIPIEKILEMSSSSKSCWSENIIQERIDRI